MDSFFDKLSIYDFFNLLASGIVFLCGLLALEVFDLSDLADLLAKSPEMEWISFVVILGVCYLVGAAFQQFSSIVFEKKYSEKITSTILCDRYSVLNNPIKLEVHQRYAQKLFDEKEILFSGTCFSTWYCDYYFAYCTYYIQNQNKHQKAEKMRGLRGLYSSLITCFALLLLISLFIIPLSKTTPDWTFCGIEFGIESIRIILFIFFLICIHAYKINTKYWVRMVLGIYETCVDIDNREMKNN